MMRFVRFVFSALILSSIAYAQNLPAIDISGGYSYLKLKVPETGLTNAHTFTLQGFDGAFSVALFHHLAVEADFSGHRVTNCGGVTTLTCSDFSYLFGPRYTFGDHASKATFFIHGLVGQDRATLLQYSGNSTLSDTATGVAGGVGLDYWFTRRIGFQLGPVDALYTNHLNNDGANSQLSYRAAGGVAFRLGGNLPAGAPKTPKQVAPKPKTHRSILRPWHKTVVQPAEGEEPATAPAPSPTTTTPTTTTTVRTRPAQPTATMTSRGMSIPSMGVVVAPQEFDGAKITQVVAGSVAEMASLRIGDLIKSVDGKAVRTPMELAAELSDKVGKVRIGIQRGGFETETVILLGAR